MTDRERVIEAVARRQSPILFSNSEPELEHLRQIQRETAERCLDAILDELPTEEMVEAARGYIIDNLDEPTWDGYAHGTVSAALATLKAPEGEEV